MNSQIPNGPAAIAPPFSMETAIKKVRLAEDASRRRTKVPLARPGDAARRPSRHR
jgi:nuclear transport factor 2 (NTF2) superfamily protein